MLSTKNHKIWRVATRSHFTADPTRSPQTELVLLHAGQPWNEFHAREFLKTPLNSKIPKFINSTIANAKMMQDGIKGCIATYKNVESLENQVDRLGKRLEESLDTVVPEHGPFRVSRLFRFNEIPFEVKFKEILSHRSQKYIFMPLYPHFSKGEGENLLVETAKIIEKSSSPMMNGNREMIASRIEQNSDYSYEVRAIWRWNNHSILADYWSSKLQPLLPNLDAVVFAAPRKFQCEYGPIHSTCERTINQLGDVIPWRLGFYSTWDSFDLPAWKSIQSQVEKFKNLERKKKIAVIPITDVIETFDTIYTIPKKVEHLKNALVLRPDQESEKLVHGIAEIVKNSLLGRKDRQLEVSATPRNLQNLSLFFN